MSYATLQSKIQQLIEIAQASSDAETLVNLVERDITVIEIPEGTTRIGAYIFYDCTSLEKVTIPSSVTHIGTAAFYNCEKLEMSELPSVETIGIQAFQSCPAVTIDTIPATVTAIGSQAFQNCAGITNLTFEGVPQRLSAGAFANCPNLISLTCPWYEDDIANAPWGATNATIHYLERPKFSVINNLTNITNSNSANEAEQTKSYTLTLTPDYGYQFGNVTVTMNGETLVSTTPTGSSYSFTIEAVTGEIVITAAAEKAVIVNGTYTVDLTAEGSNHGFIVDGDWYKSDIYDLHGFYAMAKINLNIQNACTVRVTGKNNAETGWDFGVIGKLDANLSFAASITDDSGLIAKSFKSVSNNEMIGVDFEVPTGSHYIYVKYLKDGSGTNGDDAFRFKVEIL